MLDEVLAREQEPTLRHHARIEAELHRLDEAAVLAAHLGRELHHRPRGVVGDLVVEKVVGRADRAAGAVGPRDVDG